MAHATGKPSPIDERRAQFQRYKEDVKKRGKPFYPYAMFHDTVMSLVVVSVIVGLASIWKWTSFGPHHDGTHQGLLGPEYTAPADPGTTSFVPRPDWYFYFLFYLLRIFKWPESVFLGTVGVPNILLVLLLALPFIDLRRERRLSRRPVAVVAAVLTRPLDGRADLEGRDRQGGARLRGDPRRTGAGSRPRSCRRRPFPARSSSPSSGCTACHTYNGSGSSNLGAPDLTSIGSAESRDRLPDPASQVPVVREPGLADAEVRVAGDKRLRQLAIFLEASKGKQ